MQRVAGQNHVAQLQQKQPPKDRRSDAPSEDFDVHAVTKLHQESMAGCACPLTIKQAYSCTAWQGRIMLVAYLQQE
jgi:hypothetical protein